MMPRKCFHDPFSSANVVIFGVCCIAEHGKANWISFAYCGDAILWCMLEEELIIWIRMNVWIFEISTSIQLQLVIDFSTQPSPFILAPLQFTKALINSLNSALSAYSGKISLKEKILIETMKVRVKIFNSELMTRGISQIESLFKTLPKKKKIPV